MSTCIYARYNMHATCIIMHLTICMQHKSIHVNIIYNMRIHVDMHIHVKTCMPTCIHTLYNYQVNIRNNYNLWHVHVIILHITYTHHNNYACIRILRVITL